MEEKIYEFMTKLAEISALQETMIDAMIYCQNIGKSTEHINPLAEETLILIKELHKNMDYLLISN